METLPPIETSQLADKPLVLQVTEEMKRFRDDMMKILMSGDGSNDIRGFWLRKSESLTLV
jgi:hypothetical protein